MTAVSGFYDGQHIPPLDGPNVNPERVQPEILGAADNAASALARILKRYGRAQGVLPGSLMRQADARTLREIAEAVTDLAKALK